MSLRVCHSVYFPPCMFPCMSFPKSHRFGMNLNAEPPIRNRFQKIWARWVVLTQLCNSARTNNSTECVVTFKMAQLLMLTPSFHWYERTLWAPGIRTYKTINSYDLQLVNPIIVLRPHRATPSTIEYFNEITHLHNSSFSGSSQLDLLLPRSHKTEKLSNWGFTTYGKGEHTPYTGRTSGAFSIDAPMELGIFFTTWK